MPLRFIFFFFFFFYVYIIFLHCFITPLFMLMARYAIRHAADPSAQICHSAAYDAADAYAARQDVTLRYLLPFDAALPRYATC